MLFARNWIQLKILILNSLSSQNDKYHIFLSYGIVFTVLLLLRDTMTKGATLRESISDVVTVVEV